MTITNKVTNRSMMPGITPVSDVPDAPTIGTATAGNATATVTFTAAVTGGTPTLYRAISTPDSIQGTNTASPITVSGLTNGTAYTFTVRGENSTANGPYSSATTEITPISLSSYFSIQTATVDSGNASTVTFSNIPQTYTHLQIRAMMRVNRGSSIQNGINAQINGETSSNYAIHSGYASYLYGNPGAGYVTANNQLYLGELPSTGSTANVFGVFIMDVFDYTSTNKYKTFRILSGYDGNGNGGNCGIFSGMFYGNLNALTSISFYEPISSCVQYSTFSLYGVK